MKEIIYIREIESIEWIKSSQKIVDSLTTWYKLVTIDRGVAKRSF